jgi:hypothetical protein
MRVRITRNIGNAFGDLSRNLKEGQVRDDLPDEMVEAMIKSGLAEEVEENDKGELVPKAAAAPPPPGPAPGKSGEVEPFTDEGLSGPDSRQRTAKKLVAFGGGEVKEVAPKEGPAAPKARTPPGRGTEGRTPEPSAEPPRGQPKNT